MVNIISVALDALNVGTEGSKDLMEIHAGLPVDFHPEAKALLKFLADFKVQEPWLTEDLAVELLQLVEHFLESKKPPAV